jgi:hypothetical protein
MQASARQQELERLYNARKGHGPQISISDDSQHITEAIGSYYETEDAPGIQPGGLLRDTRPLSFVPGEKETYDTKSRRQGTYLEGPPNGLFQAHSTTREYRGTSPGQPTLRLTPVESLDGQQSPGQDNGYNSASQRTGSPISPHSSLQISAPQSPNVSRPQTLSRQPSAEAVVQKFPLNDIDYESSPAAVAQELSNLQAIRRMSMNVDKADPDLPSFSGPFSNIPAAPSRQSDDENDPSKLFWVPARLHPELAPKEFKTFIEERVEKIRRRSGSEDSLSVDGLERSGSDSSLRRKKSMLSHQIDARDHYEDGAERLSRKRSKGMHVEGQTIVENLSDLETLVKDPALLLRRMSLDTSRQSFDSGVEVASDEDPPILPAGGLLKRSTRTTYRRGSVKKGERNYAKRGHRRTSSDADEHPPVPQILRTDDSDPALDITRVLTDPAQISGEGSGNFSRPHQRPRNTARSPTSEEFPYETEYADNNESLYAPEEHEQEVEVPLVQPQPQPKRFQSRIASQGRTTAQLPGYNNTNPLPDVLETLPDGSKVPAPGLLHNLPERKSSHDVPRQFQRGGSQSRNAPNRQGSQASSFDDLSQSPSPLPGSGNNRTDSLTVVPTFEEKKVEKKESSKKSGWKWILGNDDDEKEKKIKEEKNEAKSKGGKAQKGSSDKARLDVLQNSIDGNAPARGRESLVLNREDIKIEEERKPSKKSESRKESQPGLLSALFGGKKKSYDGDLKDKKRKADRNHSPDPVLRYLKPDIDYNWTRFSILEERAIYRLAHVKLANPRRALHSQVLLSNFMYSYLAKVQMMHPQIQIPAAQRAAQQKNQPKSESQKQQTQQQEAQQKQQQQQQEAQQRQQQQQQQELQRRQRQQQPPPQRTDEYDQYQQWHEVSTRSQNIKKTRADDD